MNQAKNYATMCEAVGMCETGQGVKMVEELSADEYRRKWVAECVPTWVQRRLAIVSEEGWK